jgi:hypothetical protein
MSRARTSGRARSPDEPSRRALGDLVNALLDMPLGPGGAFGPPPLAAGRS